jgi:hypothetical protein
VVKMLELEFRSRDIYPNPPGTKKAQRTIQADATCIKT